MVTITLQSSINFGSDDEFMQYICTNLDYVKTKIDEQNRIRENARFVVEEVRRINAERLVSEVELTSHYRFTRPDLSFTARAYLLRRAKDHGQEAQQGATVRAFKA